MKIWKALLAALVIIVVIGATVGGLLIWRGFRASATPAAWEAGLASTGRNLAIPRHERGQKIPLGATPEVMQQGRTLFLTQCATCHGIDGSGKTAVGLNLYPRVPDLRAAATQDLSDGEIHYIIENGVQLTGMPAWGNPHGESTGNSWKLVLYLRSLRPLDKQEKSQQATTGASAHYVGSQSCEKCHAEIY